MLVMMSKRYARCSVTSPGNNFNGPVLVQPNPFLIRSIYTVTGQSPVEDGPSARAGDRSIIEPA